MVLPLLFIGGILIVAFVVVLFIVGTLFVLWNPWPIALMVVGVAGAYVFAKVYRKPNKQ